MTDAYRRKLAAISIHSPRMGRDRVDARENPLYYISIHSPRMGRDRTVRTLIIA